MDLPIDRYLNLVYWWAVKVLATHRQDTIDAWLDEPDPTAPRDDDPVWSAEAEMAAFAQLQAAAL